MENIITLHGGLLPDFNELFITKSESQLILYIVLFFVFIALVSISEKRTLSLLVETSFYAPVSDNKESPSQSDEKMKILESLESNPGLVQQLLQLLQSSAATV